MVIKKVAYGIVRGLTEFLNCEELQDFTVCVGSVQFRCHRLLLAACSDFFRGLFRSRMKEMEHQLVTLKDMTSETFELILKSHVILTNDNVIDIWRAAHQLLIPFLLSQCEKFVIENLTMDNYAEYFYVSNTLNATVALETLWPFVLKNCNAFFETSHFLQLTVDNVAVLIKSQDLNAKSEDDVIHAILKWVEFEDDPSELQLSGENMDQNEGCSEDKPLKKKKKKDENMSIVSNYVGKNVQTEDPGGDLNKNNRSKHLATFLSHARTCLASQGCLEMLVKHPLVKDNPEVKDIIIDSLFYLLQAGNRNGQWSAKALHRNNSDFMHCVVKAMGIVRVSFESYSLETRKWLKLPALVNVGIFRLAAVGSKLYALCTPYTKTIFHPKEKLYLFQLEKETWSEKEISLSLKSGTFHIAVVDSFLYIFSKYDRTAWKMDSNSQKLAQISCSPDIEIINHVKPYDQKVLVFSASLIDKYETIVRCYDTCQNSWTELDNFEGPFDEMISFKDDHFSYLLQSDGYLWKVIKPRPDVIDFVFVIQLWAREWSPDLYGAATHLGKLFIHGFGRNDHNEDPNLQRSLPGVFSEIIYVEYSTIKNTLCIHLTLDKKCIV